MQLLVVRGAVENSKFDKNNANYIERRKIHVEQTTVQRELATTQNNGK